jgi:uncharacterized membrane protein
VTKSDDSADTLLNLLSLVKKYVRSLRKLIGMLIVALLILLYYQRYYEAIFVFLITTGFVDRYRNAVREKVELENEAERRRSG